MSVNNIDKLFDYSSRYTDAKAAVGGAQKKAGNKTAAKQDAAGTMAVVKNNGVKQPELSESAQNLLEKLKKTYGSKMDFMIYDEGQDPKDLLKYSTKEYTVLFSASELEKMASDEKFEKENMDKILEAVDQLDEIGIKAGLGGESENADGSQVTRIGISFNEDGTLKLFADLEKMTVQQQERMEKIRQKRAEEKRAARRDEEKKNAEEQLSADKTEKKEDTTYRGKAVKRTSVEADSIEELLEKINSIDWDKINEDAVPSGKKLNMKI